MLLFLAIRPPAPVAPAAPGPGSAAHQVPEAEPEVALTEIDQALARQDWRTALLRAEVLLRQHPTDAAARERHGRAESELQNQFRHDSFRRAVERKNLEAAMALFAEIPVGSVYREQAEPEAAALRGTYVTAKLAEARSAQRLRLCDEVRRLARVVLSVDADNRDAAGLEAACQPGALTAGSLGAVPAVAPGAPVTRHDEPARRTEPPGRPPETPSRHPPPAVPKDRNREYILQGLRDPFGSP